MAKKPAAPAVTPAKPAAYEADALYSIKVNRVIDFQKTRLRPMDSYRIKGALLSEISDAIATATKL